MAILNPTQLETADYGTSGWNAIFSSNFQKINNFFKKLWKMLTGSYSDNDKLVKYNAASDAWEFTDFTASQVMTKTVYDTDNDGIVDNADKLDGYDAGHSSGQIPISDGTLNTDLNADKVDGFDASQTPGANQIPVLDASGNLAINVNQLQDVTSAGTDIDDAVSKRHTQNTDKQIQDTDGDTVITTEETTDADTIVGKVAGTEAWRIFTSGIVSFPKQSATKMYLSADQSIPAGTATKVALDSVEFDVQGEADTTNNKITITQDGIYIVLACCRFSPGADLDSLSSWIYLNGVAYTGTFAGASGTVAHSVVLATIMQLAAGDYIELYVENANSAATINGGLGTTYLSVVKIA